MSHWGWWRRLDLHTTIDIAAASVAARWILPARLIRPTLLMLQGAGSHAQAQQLQRA
jgi:hypothetical protein